MSAATIAKEMISEAAETGAVMLAYESIKAVGRKLFTKVAEEAGEKIPKAVENWVTANFGLDTEDERRFLKAKSLMDKNHATVLNKFLFKLKHPTNPAISKKRFNLYRITVLDEDIEVMVRTMTAHARMSPEQWDKECEIMGYNFEQDQNAAMLWFTTHWAKISPAIAAWHANANQQFHDHLLRERVSKLSEKLQKQAKETKWS